MREGAQDIILPPNPADYLTDWLWEIGPTTGDRTLSFVELAAWQSISGVKLEPWEAKTLRRLSGEYLSQCNRSRKVTCPAPYTGRIEEKREKVAGQFAAMMKAVQARAGVAKKGTTDGGSAGR